MNQLQQHMKIMWIDQKEHRERLSETEITSVPCIIVYKNGNRILYQGDEFQSYWNEFIRSYRSPYKTNFLNSMHSQAMSHVDQINQSLQQAKQSIQTYQDRKALLSEDDLTDGLQSQLIHHMNQFQSPSNEPKQSNQHESFARAFKLNPTNHIEHQSSLGQLRQQIEQEHMKIKASHLSLQKSQETHHHPLQQLKMANSLLQQNQPF
jgi:hypothetical protein